MAIRKEQVLVLLVLAIGGWIYSGLGSDGGAMRAGRDPKRLDYAAANFRPVPLLGNQSVAFARAEVFTEPRETRPLPPRELQFPARPPLSLCGLPLEPGPGYAHSMLLREDGQVVPEVTLAPPTENAVREEASAAVPQDAAARRALLPLTYDQVWVGALSNPYYGFVEIDGMDPLDAEKLTSFDEVTVRLREYSVSKGKIDRVQVFDKDNLNKVRQIRLAQTLRNEVRRAIRQVPADAAHLDDRGKLISWLLGKAREAAWIYDEAMQQAGVYSQLSGGDIEGLRWQLRVLQARGDLAGEYALLDGIVGDYRETAFRYEGLGRVKAQLGLHADAERDLRRAVEIGRTDARPAAALAEFLRERGRFAEALTWAARAEQTVNSVFDSNDRVRVVRSILASRLGAGQLDAARDILALLPSDRPQPYLVGCVAYASGNLTLALDCFRSAAAGGEAAAGLLGQAAVLLRQQQWQAANEALHQVADQAPLLRHRAYSGLALLHLRLGQLETAMQHADRALEAHPQDPYTHYLRGRILREQRNFGAAEEAIEAALRLQDDFVHAIAEMAALQSARADSAADPAAATIRAMRFGDRAVALAPKPQVELYERQGLYRFASGLGLEAKAAFARARDLAATEPERQFAKGALAVVDYSRGMVDEAVATLSRFRELPKDDPIRQWAEDTLRAIEDHAAKEILEDHFERAEIGSIWALERDGTVTAQLAENRLQFRGKLSRTGEVAVDRTGAVQKSMNFLAVGCSMQLGASHSQTSGFAGLRIETQRGSSGQADTQIWLGVREGRPHLRMVDAREEPRMVELAIPGFDRRASHRLELRMVPRGDAQSRMLALQVRWNDVLVHEQDIKGISGGSGGALRTLLFASGSLGDAIEVAFDDYMLERRKER